MENKQELEKEKEQIEKELDALAEHYMLYPNSKGELVPKKVIPAHISERRGMLEQRLKEINLMLESPE